MEVLTVLVILLNNIAWMLFFYIFTPLEKKRDLEIPSIIAPKKVEVKPDSLGEVTEMTLEDAAKAVGIERKVS